MTTTTSTIDHSAAAGIHRGIWIGGGVMALAIVAMATTLVTRNNDALSGAQVSTGTAQVVPVTQRVASTAPGATRQTDRVAPRHAVNRSASDQTIGSNEHTRAASVPTCTGCGVVESYSAVQVQGQNNGVGAVIGGVGGALAGSKIAGRGNHTLGGAIGAVGGGLLGNAVESHERQTTAYDVQVRMADGSVRTVRQSTVPNVGAHVNVDGALPV